MFKYKSKKLCLVFVGLIFLMTTVTFFLQKKDYDKYDIVRSLATRYYDALIQKNYDEAFELLYRTPNTMFTNEFILVATHETPPIFYKVDTISELAEGVYEVCGTGKSDDGQGRLDVTDVKNYVIYYNSKYYFVIHWSDVPSDLYDFGKIIGY